jgi:hypothetical protein
MVTISGIGIDITNNDLRGLVNADVLVRNQFVDGGGAIVNNWEQLTSVPVANIMAAGATVTAVDPTTVMNGAAAQPVGIIRIDETIAGSFATSSAITLTAPSGVSFTGTPTLHLERMEGTGEVVAITPTTITVTTTNALSVNAARIEIRGIHVNVGMAVAHGPLNVTVRGTNVDSTVTVATIGAVGVVTPSSITAAADLATRNAGLLNQGISGIRLTENLPNAFAGNRALTLTLPVGFSWNTVPQPAWASVPTISDDDRTVTFWTITDPLPVDTNRFNLENLTINTHITAPAGDIVVTVGGNTGATGSVTVAKLRRPVTVTAVTAPNVRADSLGQALGNLVITEAHQGALRTGTLTVTLPAGTSLVGTPSVAVADVTGTEPTVTVTSATGNVITLQVTAASGPTNPTSVTVSGIRVNLDRIPAGTAITAAVGGTSLLEGAPAVPGLAGTDLDAARGTVAGEAAIGNVITRTARRTVFTVDATAFTVDGVIQPALEVAPVIQEGRTMMPIRAAANAAGVTNDNILFDAGVITIIRGDRIAQFTLGSRVMVVNGIAMNMDVAPALVSGRALIPVRWVGTALGVPVVWDGTARTVTVSVQ